MDPVTHTLVGATLAQAGLKRRTALGTATLLIGANLPDVDVLAYFWGGATAVWFRRGLTHGALALVVWPFVLTGLVLLWARLARRGRAGSNRPVITRQVFLLSAVAVASHPLLDFLNVYGMRWLAPFSNTWFYGDTLFIIDPWVWGVLAAGIWAADKGVKWARLALLAVSTYAVMMAMSNVAARSIVSKHAARDGIEAQRIMVAPMAVSPFRRWVVIDDGSGYRAGMFDWLDRPMVELVELPYETFPDAAVEQAVRQEHVRRFLSWARFPYYLTVDEESGSRVYIGDTRYGLDPENSWAATSVVIDRDEY
jgi:inner membrane protein